MKTTKVSTFWNRYLLSTRKCHASFPRFSAIARCTVTSAPTSDEPHSPAPASPWSRVKEIFCPFHSSEANARFLALGLGGMLCSIGTLIHDSYLPVFMRDELGLSNSSIGGVQAISQLLCQISKSFSGVMGDLLGSQVKILMFGTFMTAVSKPLFATSQFVWAGFGAAACLWCITIGKMLDRVSKGFREAPTKALISQTAQRADEPSDSAFSLRQSFVTVGSVVGTAVATGVFLLSGASYTVTFAAAAVPAFLAFTWLVYVFRGDISGVPKTPETPPTSSVDERGNPEASQEMSIFHKIGALVRAFSPGYWQALVVVSVLYFGRFDFTWVTLRAKTCSVPTAMLPTLATVCMMWTTVTSFSVGRYAKGKGVKSRNTVLLIGMAMLIIANFFLASPWSASPAGMFAACSFIGIHMGMTHGLLLSTVSSYMPHQSLKGIGNLSGTAWSFTDMVLGCILAASNSLAGQLTDMTVNLSMGNTGCFLGGSLAAISASLLLLMFIQFGALGKELPSRGGKSSR